MKVGVHQGSALSPLLFVTVLDFLTSNIQDEAPWSMLYADDIVLLAYSAAEMQIKLDKLVNCLETNGLKVNVKKTEHMLVNIKDEDANNISINGEPLLKCQKFKYLGSVMSNTCDVRSDVNACIQAGWLKWQSVTGVLCDKKMPLKLKSKVYKAVVRPALLYALESWATKKKDEQALHAAEMKMLRWSCGVTLKDRKRNEDIRQRMQVTPIKEKAQRKLLTVVWPCNV